MLTTKIDGSMYAIMPMNHLYAMSRYPYEISRAGDYPAAGSPNAKIRLLPNVGDYVCVQFQMFNEAASSGYITFYITNLAGSTRVMVGAEQLSTATRASYTSNPGGARIRTGWNMSAVGALGDLRGEDCVLEMYLKNLTSTVNLANMRVMAGTSQYFTSDYMR
jgi:hypothetical protein